MTRRKDGRELFEVFRQTASASAPSAKAGATGATGQAPAHVAEKTGGGGETGATGGTGVHRFCLGDSPKVEMFFSIGWVVGIAIFIALVVLGAFVLGRRLGPARGAAVAPEAVDAPEEYVAAAAKVGQAGRVTASRPDETGRGTQGVAATGATGAWMIRVASYPDTNMGKALAEKTARSFSAVRYPEVRVMAEKSGKRQLVVVVGAFASNGDRTALEMQSRIKSMPDFRSAYIVPSNDYKQSQ